MEEKLSLVITLPESLAGCLYDLKLIRVAEISH